MEYIQTQSFDSTDLNVVKFSEKYSFEISYQTAGLQFSFLSVIILLLNELNSTESQ